MENQLKFIPMREKQAMWNSSTVYTETLTLDIYTYTCGLSLTQHKIICPLYSHIWCHLLSYHSTPFLCLFVFSSFFRGEGMGLEGRYTYNALIHIENELQEKCWTTKSAFCPT